MKKLLCVVILLAGLASAQTTRNTVNLGTVNGATLQQMANGMDSTGAGIIATGMVAQCDDTAPTVVTENNFGPLRIDCRRKLLTINQTQVTISDNVTANVANPMIQSATLDGLNGRGSGVYEWCYDGATLDGCRGTGLANTSPSTTTSANNDVGARLVENGGRWVVNSAPAANSQATASIAAEASVRHVATRVCYSAGSTTAPALTSKTIVLRDGATGAGTVLLTLNVTISAVTGNNIAPNCIDIGNLVGTTNTAMTAEWDAGLTSLSETVTLEGYNIN